MFAALYAYATQKPQKSEKDEFDNYREMPAFSVHYANYTKHAESSRTPVQKLEDYADKFESFTQIATAMANVTTFDAEQFLDDALGGSMHSISQEPTTLDNAIFNKIVNDYLAETTLLIKAAAGSFKADHNFNSAIAIIDAYRNANDKVVAHYNYLDSKDTTGFSSSNNRNQFASTVTTQWIAAHPFYITLLALGRALSKKLSIDNANGDATTAPATLDEVTAAAITENTALLKSIINHYAATTNDQPCLEKFIGHEKALRYYYELTTTLMSEALAPVERSPVMPLSTELAPERFGLNRETDKDVLAAVKAQLQWDEKAIWGIKFLWPLSNILPNERKIVLRN